MDWAGLSKLKSLRSFHMNYMNQNYEFPTETDVERIAESLPESVKKLDLSMTWTESGIGQWIEELQSPHFAPYLECLKGAGDYYQDAWEGRTIESLADTIITRTGCIRPIRKVTCCIYETDLALFNKFALMESLDVHLFVDIWTNAMSIIRDAMPRLTSFKGTIAPSHEHDGNESLSGLLSFLSRRPITKLELESVYKEEGTAWTPFTQDDMKLWSAMTQLTSLKIVREVSKRPVCPSPIFVENNTAMISLVPSCWSAMTNFTCDLLINNPQLLMLVMAMPNVEHFTLSHADDDVNVASSKSSKCDPPFKDADLSCGLSLIHLRQLR